MKWNKIFDELFYMSKTERNGAVVLVILIILVIIFRFFIPHLFLDKKDYTKEIDKKIELLKARQDSINQPKAYSIKKSKGKVHPFPKEVSTSNNSKQKEALIEIEYFKFDPNTVEYSDLLKLGFAKKLANMLIKYRENGGRFRTANDLLKLYDIDSSFFQKIKPYVITTEPIKTLHSIAEIKKIEINSADSAKFTELKGVGPVFASRICKYRKLLGGFSNIEQIKEVYKFPVETFDMIKSNLLVDTTKIDRININFVNVTDLKKHPYCNYNLAKKIVDYRSLNGSLKSIEQLLTDSVFSVLEFKKMQPYLAVE